MKTFITTVVLFLVEVCFANVQTVELLLDGKKIILPLDHPIRIARLRGNLADLNYPIPHLADLLSTVAEEATLIPPPAPAIPLPYDRALTFNYNQIPYPEAHPSNNYYPNTPIFNNDYPKRQPPYNYNLSNPYPEYHHYLHHSRPDNNYFATESSNNKYPMIKNLDSVHRVSDTPDKHYADPQSRIIVNPDSQFPSNQYSVTQTPKNWYPTLINPSDIRYPKSHSLDYDNRKPYDLGRNSPDSLLPDLNDSEPHYAKNIHPISPVDNHKPQSPTNQHPHSNQKTTNLLKNQAFDSSTTFVKNPFLSPTMSPKVPVIMTIAKMTKASATDIVPTLNTPVPSTEYIIPVATPAISSTNTVSSTKPSYDVKIDSDKQKSTFSEVNSSDIMINQITLIPKQIAVNFPFNISKQRATLSEEPTSIARSLVSHVRTTTDQVTFSTSKGNLGATTQLKSSTETAVEDGEFKSSTESAKSVFNIMTTSNDKAILLRKLFTMKVEPTKSEYDVSTAPTDHERTLSEGMLSTTQIAPLDITKTLYIQMTIPPQEFATELDYTTSGHNWPIATIEYETTLSKELSSTVEATSLDTMNNLTSQLTISPEKNAMAMDYTTSAYDDVSIAAAKHETTLSEEISWTTELASLDTKNTLISQIPILPLEFAIETDYTTSGEGISITATEQKTTLYGFFLSTTNSASLDIMNSLTNHTTIPPKDLDYTLPEDDVFNTVTDHEKILYEEANIATTESASLDIMKILSSQMTTLPNEFETAIDYTTPEYDLSIATTEHETTVFDKISSMTESGKTLTSQMSIPPKEFVIETEYTSSEFDVSMALKESIATAESESLNITATLNKRIKSSPKMETEFITLGYDETLEAAKNSTHAKEFSSMKDFAILDIASLTNQLSLLANKLIFTPDSPILTDNALEVATERITITTDLVSSASDDVTLLPDVTLPDVPDVTGVKQEIPAKQVLLLDMLHKTKTVPIIRRSETKVITSPFQRHMSESEPITSSEGDETTKKNKQEIMSQEIFTDIVTPARTIETNLVEFSTLIPYALGTNSDKLADNASPATDLPVPLVTTAFITGVTTLVSSLSSISTKVIVYPKTVALSSGISTENTFEGSMGAQRGPTPAGSDSMRRNVTHTPCVPRTRKPHRKRKRLRGTRFGMPGSAPVSERAIQQTDEARGERPRHARAVNAHDTHKHPMAPK